MLIIPALIIIFGVVAIWLKLNTPYSIKCPIHETLGIYCVTCGITRQIIALIHLDIYQAFRYNIFTAVMILPLTFLYILQFIKIYKTNKLESIKSLDKIMITILILAIIFLILRNTKWFSWLAPTII